eukprot:TRINITY_DN66045_c7_g12_i1.p1 TRINITY_DN66045_c7_g12~~TRINITY_DN66045_c7_g12_i1.p1  ORF type:complete len:823 (+),score=57.90 TRINITY_DN66045_c7_g12_i1:53-2521(+)
MGDPDEDEYGRLDWLTENDRSRQEKMPSGMQKAWARAKAGTQALLSQLPDLPDVKLPGHTHCAAKFKDSSRRRADTTVIHVELEEYEVQAFEERLNPPMTSETLVVELSHKMLQAKGVATLIVVMHKHSIVNNIVRLHLPFCKLGYNGLMVLMQDFFSQNTALESLDLSFNGLGFNGLLKLAEAVKDRTNLTDLSLKGNCGKVTEEQQKGMGFHIVLPKIVFPINGIRTLDLSRNDLRSRQILKLIDFYCNIEHMEELTLNDNHLEDDGLGKICSTFLKSKVFHTLNVQSNGLGNVGVAFASEMLKTNTSLAVLNLADNRDIDDLGFLFLVAALEFNNTLEELDLSGTKITSNIGWSLLTLWQQNSALHRIAFARTKIGADSSIDTITGQHDLLLGFFEMLKQSPTLAEVHAVVCDHPEVVQSQLWGETPPGVAMASGNKEVGRYLRKMYVTKTPHYWFSALLLLANLAIVFGDMVSDIIVCIKYIAQKEIGYFFVSLLILLASNYIIFGLLWYATKKGSKKQVFKAMPDYRWKLIPVIPLYEGISFCKGVQQSVSVHSKQLQSDLEGLGVSLSLAESIFESFPSAVLQTIVLIQQIKKDNSSTDDDFKNAESFLRSKWIDIGSIALSCISITKAIVVYVLMRRRVRTSNLFGVRTAKDSTRQKATFADARTLRTVVGKTRAPALTALTPADSPSTIGRPGRGNSLFSPLLADGNFDGFGDWVAGDDVSDEEEEEEEEEEWEEEEEGEQGYLLEQNGKLKRVATDGGALLGQRKMLHTTLADTYKRNSVHTVARRTSFSGITSIPLNRDYDEIIHDEDDAGI